MHLSALLFAIRTNDVPEPVLDALRQYDSVSRELELRSSAVEVAVFRKSTIESTKAE
jgi:chorismate-pyruvate lyase